MGVQDGRHHLGRRDDRTGDLLWKVRLGGLVNSGAMSYAVNGRQYVKVAVGTSLFAFALRQ